MIRGGFSLRSLAVVCLGENVGMFVDVCFIEMKFSEAADVNDDVAQKVDLEKT